MGRRLVRLAAGMTAVTAGLAAAACAVSAGEPADSAGRIPVAASTNVWGSVVRAVGGDAVVIHSLIDDPSADPHAYEAKPADMITLSSARLVVYNGGGYDDFFPKLVANANSGARRVVAFDLAGKGPSGSTNEHVWYDLPTVKKVADTVAAELGALSPAHKDTFAGNAATFAGKIDELAARTGRIGAEHPGAKAVVTEPVPEYLLQVAGLSDVTPAEFTQAVEEETDPPAQAMAELTGLLAGRRVAALIDNAQTETPVTRVLRESAGKHGVPVVDVTETLPAGVTGYLDWMTRQVDALASALAKT
jgi:zinc/manganese transport system substrate-binding protein